MLEKCETRNIFTLFFFDQKNGNWENVKEKNDERAELG